MAIRPIAPVHAAQNPGDLRIEPASLSLAPQGGPTPVLRLIGPDGANAVRLAPGRTSILQIRNATAEPMTLQWRGLRGTGNLEQVPTAIGPGSSGTLPVAPRDAGTVLFRAAPASDHAAGRGAQAVVVLPETIAPPVDHDLAVVLADWLLAADNSLRFGSVPPADAVAGAITVNGAPCPAAIKVAPRARLRLRVVNASVQRLMIVSCAGARPMIAAIDGQPSDLFAPIRNTIPIGPGARYDLLLDMPEAPGSQVRLVLKPTATVGGKLEPERDLLVLTAEGVPLAAQPPLVPLPVNQALPIKIPLETAHRADLTFATTSGGWTVNGIPGSAAEKPVLTVRRGDAVVLGLVNASATLVPLRIGGQAVRLLHAKDDGWEPYWRDTLLLPPKSRNHVAFVADTEGLWPIDSGFDDLTLAGLSCAFSVGPR